MRTPTSALAALAAAMERFGPPRGRSGVTCALALARCEALADLVRAEGFETSEVLFRSEAGSERADRRTSAHWRRLETHAWHAKRFALAYRWGWALPLGAPGKGRGWRETMRRAAEDCVAHDASYHAAFVVRFFGPRERRLNENETNVKEPGGSQLATDLRSASPLDTARAFVESKLRGFECVDERWAPSDPNLSAFGKSLGAPKAPPVAAAAKTAKAVKVPEPAAESSPISVLPAQDDERATEGPTPAAASESTAALETAFQKVAVAEEAPAPAPAPLFAAFASAPVAAPEALKTISFADFGSAAPDSDASSDESEEGDVEDASEDEDAAGDAGEAEADDILGQLVEMFKAENGRDPTEEEVAQWVQTLKDASAEGGLVL